jgi:putative transposase
MLIDHDCKEITVERQCALLELNRSTYYYTPRQESDVNLKLMRAIDEEFTRHPFYGARKMREYLRDLGYQVGRELVTRLMGLMGLEAQYQKPKLSKQNPENKVFPYLLRGVKIDRCNQVWSTDITYIPMRRGFLYLVAIMDWYSRYVLSWRLSNTLDAEFCIEALEEALQQGVPEIFNTDQGTQFTSNRFVDVVTGKNIAFSMDGKGRAIDNVFIERLWRSLKYEEVYPNDYQDGIEAFNGLRRYLEFYNRYRPHQSLGYQTPAAIHFGCKELEEKERCKI